MKKCFSCGGLYPDTDGPTHRYMTSTPGCWAVYGEVLAREYSDAKLMAIHRLSVDAYAVQHPGGTDRQSIQSVGVHLIRLCLFLEFGLRAENANAAMLAAGKNKQDFTFLQPPKDLGAMTAADIAKASTTEEHRQLVEKWAVTTWQAWQEHHATIRSWIPDHLKSPL